jgi:glycine dehydrogenase
MVFDFEPFQSRHIGPDAEETAAMVKAVGASSMDALIDEAIPARIRLPKPLNLADGESEYHFLRELQRTAAKNQVFRSFLGLGYYDTITPSVILRNVLENPGWYTPYTPYQAEIAQGRLESLLNFQTMVRDLTGMEVANASLLDEATAAAEAMTMLARVQAKRIEGRVGAPQFLVSDSCFPQTLDVLRARAEPLGIEILLAPNEMMAEAEFGDRVFGALVQTPDEAGRVHNLRAFIARAKEAGVLVAVGTDLLSLALLTPPGEMGADVVYGNSQRFGVPLGYGGPHAAFFATLEKHVRQAPGRIIGVSIDAHGNTAYRMSLQTREQHIRREKATSNICTAQALLANIAGLYAVYHGPKGLTRIASRVHGYAKLLEHELGQLGFRQLNDFYFDTPRFEVPGGAQAVGQILKSALKSKVNLGYRRDGSIHVALDETTDAGDIAAIVLAFAAASGGAAVAAGPVLATPPKLDLGVSEGPGPHLALPDAPGVQHASFGNADDALHPQPRAQGHRPRHVDDPARVLHDEAQRGVRDAADHVARVREAASVRPGGAGGRLPADLPRAGIDALRDHRVRGRVAAAELRGAGRVRRADGHPPVPPRSRRDAPRRRADPGVGPRHQPGERRHGRHARRRRRQHREGNYRRRRSDGEGRTHKDSLAALMVTYPSDARRVRESIRTVCATVHEQRRPGLHGRREHERAGRPYQPRRSSAPTSATSTCTRPSASRTAAAARDGADRRRGAPGAVPAGASDVVKTGGARAIHALSRRRGERQHPADLVRVHEDARRDGMTDCTRYAILNANYLKSRLEPYFPVLYTRENGRVAHEMIFDLRPLKQASGIDETDVAKR